MLNTPKYTPEQLQYQTVRFFENTENDKIKVKTLNGLRLWLGITAREWQELNRNVEYDDVVDEIKTKLEMWLEERLLLDNKPVGAIFALKSRFGWTDLPQHNKNVSNYIYVFGNEKAALMNQGKKILDVDDIGTKKKIGMKAIPKVGRPKGSKSTKVSKRKVVKKNEK